MLSGSPNVSNAIGALPIANGGTGGNAVSQNTMLSNAKSLLLSNWRIALANVRNGTANARILCVGDSTTLGKGSSTATTFPTNRGYPARLAQLLNSSVTPVAHSLGVPVSSYGSIDNRWTVGSGWGVQGNYFGAGGQACYKSTGTSGNLVFTAGVNADSYYVYYLGNAGLGMLTCTATGGSAVVINTGSLAAGVYRTLVTASAASASNTVALAGSGSNAYVVGVEPFLSTVPQVLIGNAGVASTQTNDWVQSAANFGAIPFIKTVAPNLTVISLGINDASGAVVVGTYIANLQLLINAAKVSGDVVLVDFPPLNNGAPTSTYAPQYIPQILALAQTNNILYASLYARFGSSYLSALMADTIHPNDQGYWDWAQFIAGLIGSS